MKNNEDSFGSLNTLEVFRHLFFEELTILKNVVANIESEKALQLRIILATICNTGSAIGELSKKPELFHGEMVMLSRAFIEKNINFLYLNVCEQNEYDKFFNHLIAKSIRKLDRNICINNQTLSIKHKGFDPENLQKNQKDALDMFTSKTGKEITQWTKVNIEGRLELIAKNCNINTGIFMLNTLSIYEDASEALHGTLYGCTFFTWAYEPGIDKNNPMEVLKNTNRKTTLILWQLACMSHETLVFLSKDNNIDHLLSASKKNIDNSLSLMKSILSK